jgi:hypothetical protein
MKYEPKIETIEISKEVQRNWWPSVNIPFAKLPNKVCAICCGHQTF